MDKVKWFRERADRDRFREEVDILEAEFERTIISHSRMAEVWSELATKCSLPGATAYAYKKAEMYQGLSKECSLTYDAVRKKPAQVRVGTV